MTAMRWEKSGASSVIQFGLAIHPRFDPEFFALMDTMMLFRKYCSPDLAFPVLTALVCTHHHMLYLARVGSCLRA